MAMSYDNLSQAERDVAVTDRLRANDIARFDANENRKAIRVRAGITPEQRAAQLALQAKIIADCLKTKVALLASIGQPQADPTTWSYTGNLTLNAVQYRIFPAGDRTDRKTATLKAIEAKYYGYTMDVLRITNSVDPAMDVVTGSKTRRQVLLDSLATQMMSAELEKAERIRDQSTSPAP